MLLRIISCALFCGILAADTAQEWDGAAHAKWVQSMQLGRRQVQNGKFEEALETLTTALKLVANNGERRSEQAVNLNNLGDVADELGKFREAEQYYKRSITIWESLGVEALEPLSRPLNNLALLYSKMGRRAEAHRLYVRSLEIRTGLKGPNHPDLAPVLNHLCRVEVAMRKFSDAEARCRQSIAIMENAGAAIDPTLALAYTNLASLHRAKGDLPAAARFSEKALNIAGQSPGIRPSMMIHMLTEATGIRLEIDARDEAATMLQRAESAARQYLNPGHPVFATIYLLRAKLLRSDNHKAVAQELEQRADEIIRSHRRENAMESVVDVSELKR